MKYLLPDENNPKNLTFPIPKIGSVRRTVQSEERTVQYAYVSVKLIQKMLKSGACSLLATVGPDFEMWNKGAGKSFGREWAHPAPQTPLSSRRNLLV